MDKSQYHPPKTVHSAELYAEIDKSAVSRSPERLQAPFQFIKDIEMLTESFRETAQAIEEANGREVKIKYIPVTFVRPARKRDDIRKALIDTERVIGSTLFAEKNKYYFWYGETGGSAATSPDVANWYFEEIVPNSPTGGAVTHIETHPQYIKKFNHDGQLVPVTLSDLEIFIPAAYHYVHAIMDAYPFDKARAEVLLDDLEMPNDVAALLPPTRVTKSDYRRAA